MMTPTVYIILENVLEMTPCYDNRIYQFTLVKRKLRLILYLHLKSDYFKSDLIILEPCKTYFSGI